MKNLIGIIILNLIFVSCSSGQKENSISDNQLRIFFDSELEKFSSLKSDQEIQVARIKDINNYLSKSTKPNSAQINLQNLNWYNIEQKLLLPFKQGKISTDQFLIVIDTLNRKLAEYIPLYFQKYRYDQFKSNDTLLNKVIDLSKNYNQTKDFLIRATQRPIIFKQEIIDSIRSREFYNSRHPEVDILLSRFTEVGEDNEILALLEHSINNLPEETRLRWNPAGDGTNVFDHLLNNGNNETRSATLLLLYSFLDKAATSAALQFHHTLSQEFSEEIKNLMETKLDKQKNISSPEELRKEENQFFQNYLSPYAKNHRTSSLPLIEAAMILDASKLSFEENGTNFKISDYQDEVIVRNGISALISLSQLQDLTQTEKEKIYNSFLKSNLLKAKGYYWRDAIKLIQNLYPNSKYEDYQNIFSEVPESSKYTSIEGYWNRNKYSVSELHSYLSFFDSINIDTSQIEKKKYHEFDRRYRNDDRETVIWGVMDLLGISINYDCETGVWPNPYDELINQYLNVSNELEGFYPVNEYEKINDTFETRYTTIVYNGSYGYLSNPKDNGDWYDPNTVEKMLNLTLEEVGSNKRFIQLNSGDQTVLSIYAEPGQVKKIVERFDMKLVNEY